jgi:hypothetical protein
MKIQKRQMIRNSARKRKLTIYILTFTSSEMIKIYDKHAKGAEYKDPQYKYTTNLKTTAYVENINAHIIYNPNQTSQQIKQEVKENAAIWEKILCIT